MKKAIIASLLISSFAYADSARLNAEFSSLVSKTKVGVLKEQAYCYSQNGQVQGYQPQRMQRIASVTKLISSLMISETTNLHKRYSTKFYIGKEALHIEGGSDPYFEEDKFLILMKTLNDLGYKSFKKVTFSRNFLFYDLALEEYVKITPEKTKARIEAYLKAGNSKFIKPQWNMVKKFALEEGVDIGNVVPSLSTASVSISDVNPLANENTLVYVHQSRPLHSILKTMNVQSKNQVAENIYNEGSLLKPLSTLIKEKGIDAKTLMIYNGSGLPIITYKDRKENRLDNLATCETVLKFVTLLDESLKKHKLKLSDVVAVNGGKDLGSFRTRFEEYPETHEAVISKTGTLKHTSTLAGVLLTDSTVPFAILNHTAAPATARNLQDKFVARMFDQLGSAVPESYTKISIFPWDGTDFLKPLP